MIFIAERLFSLIKRAYRLRCLGIVIESQDLDSAIHKYLQEGRRNNPVVFSKIKACFAAAKFKNPSSVLRLLEKLMGDTRKAISTSQLAKRIAQHLPDLNNENDSGMQLQNQQF